MSRDQHARRRGDRDDRHQDGRIWRKPSTIINHWADNPWGLTSGPVTGAAAAAGKWAGRAAYNRLTADRAARLGSMSHKQRLAYIHSLTTHRDALAASGAPLSVRAAASFKILWAETGTPDGWAKGVLAYVVLGLTAAFVLVWSLIEAPFLLPVFVAVAAWAIWARTYPTGMMHYLLSTAREILPTITRTERDALRADGAPAARWVSRVVVRWLVALLRHKLLIVTLTLVSLATGLTASGLRAAEFVMAASRPVWWQPMWGDLDLPLGVVAAVSVAALFKLGNRALRRAVDEEIVKLQADLDRLSDDHTGEA